MDIGHRAINLQHILKQSNVSIVFVGSAGQGLKTLKFLCADILKQSGYFVFATEELMSRIRGGTNSVEIRFAQQEYFSFTKRIDILIALNEDAILHLKSRLSETTLIISPFKSHLTREHAFYFPLFELSERLGTNAYINSIVVGLVCYLFCIEIDTLVNAFGQNFSNKPKIPDNILAAKAGFLEAEKLWPDSSIRFPAVEDKHFLEQCVLLNGAKAVAKGAIAGGCNFVCAYPMSPSTSVLVELVKKSHRYGIGVEQTEDEIAAANMAIGAWYAGGRALVTTSGGGFALMCEAVSLAGMTETPLVIMVGQRPGPATGLPTRTEQGDMNLVLYAGHGEFPRFIFAPGTIQEAFSLTKHAFNMADQFQVPVFILTDQYFLNSFYTARRMDETLDPMKSRIVKTTADYKRYAHTEDGISPRGIPGYGDGIVCVDSDEHTEAGYITEDFSVRVAMQNKRMKKFDAMRKIAIKPTFYGEANYDCLLICWGSNFYVVQESVDQLNNASSSRRFAMLHFSQIYPLHESVSEYLKKANQIVNIENNSTHQFARLVENEFQIKFHHHILQYDGLPFSATTIIANVKQIDGK
jgi:2-oxoglutarate/2-oxoacid ferredoxin oxidoreductase subunit alpha